MPVATNWKTILALMKIHPLLVAPSQIKNFYDLTKRQNNANPGAKLKVWAWPK